MRPSALIPHTRLRLLQMALIVAAGVAVYLNSLQVPFVLDDPTIGPIGQKGVLEQLLHGGARRVADATFAFNYSLHGLQVTGYHLVNLMVHLATALTLYLLAYSTLDALQHSFPRSGSDSRAERFLPLAAALLFVLHPLQTQAVTYIIQRYTSLATLLYLLAALFFIRARLAYDREGVSARSLTAAGGALTAGVLALGSKQIAATLPLMLIVLEAFLFRGRLLGRRFLIVCGTLSALLAATLLLQLQPASTGELIERLHRATSEHSSLSRTTYLLTQLRVVVTYLRLLVLPFDQSIFHPYPLYTSLFSLPVMASLALHSALTALALFLFRHSGGELRSGDHARGVLQRLVALGIAWFYVAMIVESSIFPISDPIFEHRVYLPSVGFFLVAAALAALLRNRAGAWLLLAMVCLTLGGLTIARNSVWSDGLALWQDTARKAPYKDLAQANLAGEYQKAGRPDKALTHFIRALELNPRSAAEANIHVYRLLQRLDIDRSRLSALVGPAPDGAAPRERVSRESGMYNNLGLAYEQLGEPLKARESYRAAVRVDPACGPAWYNLGLLSVRTGDRAEAGRALAQLQPLDPTLADRLDAALWRQP